MRYSKDVQSGLQAAADQRCAQAEADVAAALAAAAAAAAAKMEVGTNAPAGGGIGEAPAPAGVDTGATGGASTPGGGAGSGSASERPGATAPATVPQAPTEGKVVQMVATINITDQEKDKDDESKNDRRAQRLPGTCVGCPVGGGAKPLGGFVLGSSLDG
jgi:hypothetical protein